MTQNVISETVTDRQIDSFGRVWGRIGEVRVWLTYALDPQGTWLDTEGNYHPNAHSEDQARIDIYADDYRALQAEAQRTGTTPERILKTILQNLPQ
jgi:hypothetical protein